MGFYPTYKGGNCPQLFSFIPFLTAVAAIVNGTIGKTYFLLIYCGRSARKWAFNFF